MAEIYPSDAELGALLADEDTGVEYIPTGTAPYYVHFRRLLHRLLLSCKKANELRLYHEGGLTFGVKAGSFYNGNTLVEYAGSSGNVVQDDKATIFVHLNYDGSITIGHQLFPQVSSGCFVCLAEMTSSGGVITSIKDSRGRYNFRVPDRRETIINHTSGVQVQHYNSGEIHTNKGAIEAVYLSLPSGAYPGTKFTFVVQAAFDLQINPLSMTIFDESGSTPGKYKYCSTVGAFMSLVSDDDGNWIVVGKSGTWTEAV
jgi:hypothetical protein